jgi:small subunit ribosomal protein S6
MRYYQLTCLISPELEKEELKKIEEKIMELLKKEGGIFDKLDPPLKRSLFYPIKKFREAFLGSCYFFLEPENLKKIEEKLKSEDKILRFLITSEKAPKKIPLPKKKLKPRKVELKEFEKKLEEILGQ